MHSGSTNERSFWPLGLAALYVLCIALLGGLRGLHWVAASLAVLDYASAPARRFIRLFVPFLLVGIVYDSMRYYYWAGISGHVHVSGPYLRDLRWFGIPTHNASLSHLTPNEFWAQHPSDVLDFLCGLAYLTFVAQYVAMTLYLFWRGHSDVLRRVMWTFFAVNMMGFLTYFIYPAAPPWYVTRYGLGPALMNIAPAPAGASRFDTLLGTHFFESWYNAGVDVYGAYPSLHITYPLLVVWVCHKVPALRLFCVPAWSFFALMCLSAVYLQHHYVVDILLGTSFVGLALASNLTLTSIVAIPTRWTLRLLKLCQRLKNSQTVT